MSTECGLLMNTIATGLDLSIARVDPEFQLLVRALATCGAFMTDLSIEMQRQMQKEHGFRSLPLNLPYKNDIDLVRHTLKKVSEKSFVQTLQDQDAKTPRAIRACTEDTAADVCIDIGMLGTCDNGICDCQPGFFGEDCSVECDATDNCNDQGTCNAEGSCVCN